MTASTLSKRDRIRHRRAIVLSLRTELERLGYEDVETPILVPSPGLEPAIQAFRTEVIPELGALPRRPVWLHTSPEFAMKRLVADGWGRIYQIARVFRNGEASALHNPEFTMLEFYRPQADYNALMDDLESVLRTVSPVVFSEPFERVTVRDATLRETGIDIASCSDMASLADESRRRGFRIPDSAHSWDDVFFSVFLTAVEPKLGIDRPTFLTEYPAKMAALARIKPSDDTVAERFELFAGGVELANGFSELTDAAEQRRRFGIEQEERRVAGHEVYPLDERFLEAVGRLPPCAGVAVGLDRLVMLLTGSTSIEEVLLFPAEAEWK